VMAVAVAVAVAVAGEYLVVMGGWRRAAGRVADRARLSTRRVEGPLRMVLTGPCSNAPERAGSQAVTRANSGGMRCRSVERTLRS